MSQWFNGFMGDCVVCGMRTNVQKRDGKLICKGCYYKVIR